MAYCILYPNSPFQDLGNSRGLNLLKFMKFYGESNNLKLFINYYSMRYLKRQDIPMYYVYTGIPYWKFRNMPFLCIMYTILKFQRQEDCEIYQNSLNSRRGHKNMTFPRAPTDFQGRLKLYVYIKGMRDLGSSTEGARI